jgi:hypothetical protein
MDVTYRPGSAPRAWSLPDETYLERLIGEAQ